MSLSEERLIEQMKENIQGWLGNMMRDYEGQGVVVSTEAVRQAVTLVLHGLEKDSSSAVDKLLDDIFKGPQ